MAYNIDPNDPSSPWYQNTDWVPPEDDPNVAPGPNPSKPYQDIAYWQGKGYGTNDMFDANGQTKPGWTRTANGYEYDPSAATPPPVGGPAPAPSPAPSGTGGSLTRPFDIPPPPTPGAGTDYIPATPRFNAPPIRVPDPFRAPSYDEALNDPGYKFRLGQGQDSLQNWAAARGTLNDSGTAKALIDYGQGAASQEYGNVWDRAYNTYNTNVATQYALPWQEAFQVASAQNNNDLTGYTTQAAAGQYQKNADYLDAYNQWLAKFGIFQDQRDSTFDKQYKLLTT